MMESPSPWTQFPTGSALPDDLLVQAEEVTGRIRYAARILRSLVAYAPPPRLGKLTGLQVAVLQAVVEKGGMRLVALARRFGAAHSTISDLATRLEQRGLVIRVADDRDHRSVQIVPTWKVRRLFEDRPKREIHLPMAGILARATPEEREQILDGFRVLGRLFDEENSQRYSSGQRLLGSP
ncbi:MAG: MarR family winged helix-turn-helix transcriptional regulator [Symbiobacteriia bacterium]